MNTRNSSRRSSVKLELHVVQEFHAGQDVGAEVGRLRVERAHLRQADNAEHDQHGDDGNEAAK
jgi:hypothetical protein